MNKSTRKTSFKSKNHGINPASISSSTQKEDQSPDFSPQNLFFSSLNEREFTSFAAQSPMRSFYQTPEIGHLREKSGWKIHYFGIKLIKNKSKNSNNSLLAAGMFLGKTTHFKKTLWYCPGGPLIDYENQPLVDFFFENLKKTLKKFHAVSLRISPYYELISRDRHGEIILPNPQAERPKLAQNAKKSSKTSQKSAENVQPSSNSPQNPSEDLEDFSLFDHSSALQNLQKIGFLPEKSSDIPRYSFALDINGRTKNELFADFKSNTRNHVRAAIKRGVTIREINKSELPIFKKITSETAARRHFIDQPLSYYEAMYDLFHEKGQVKFLLAEVDQSALDSPKITEPSSKIDPSPSKITNPLSTVSPNTSKIIKSPAKTPLSAAMFILYGDEIIYLFSGSAESYMKEFNAQYLIQWHMIAYAADHGFKRYNFYGINSLPDKTNPDYGLYSFKKGFGGHVLEYIGSFTLPLSPLYYLKKLFRS